LDTDRQTRAEERKNKVRKKGREYRENRKKLRDFYFEMWLLKNMGL
jgi:hypothetical protein